MGGIPYVHTSGRSYVHLMTNEQHLNDTPTTTHRRTGWANKARIGIAAAAAVATLGTTIAVAASAGSHQDPTSSIQIELPATDGPTGSPVHDRLRDQLADFLDRLGDVVPDMTTIDGGEPDVEVLPEPTVDDDPVETETVDDGDDPADVMPEAARAVAERFVEAMRTGDASLVAGVATPVAAEIITWWGVVPEGFPEAELICEHVHACFISLDGATVELVLSDDAGAWMVVDTYAAHDGEQAADDVRQAAQDFFTAFVDNDIATMQALAPTTDPFAVGLDRSQPTAEFWCESDTICAIHLDVRGYLLHLGDGAGGPIEWVQPVGTWVESPSEAFSILQAAVEAGDTWIAQFVATSDVRDLVDWSSTDRSIDIDIATDAMTAVWNRADGSTVDLRIVHGAKGGSVITLAG